MAKEDAANRRDFLKLAGTVLPVAAVAVASDMSAADAAEPDPDRETLQDTPHTRAYYESARF